MSEQEPRKSRGAVEPATVQPLASLLDVVPGAIVSRTIHNADGGTLTFFAFDEGQSLSEHTSPYNAFVQVVEGAVDLRIGGKPVAARAGDFVLMPANVPHALVAAAPLKMLLTMYR